MKCSSIFFGLAWMVLLFAFTSCEDESISCTQLYEIQDYTGLDGCGLVLVPVRDKAGRILQPINLGDFNIDVSPGTTLCIDFDVPGDLASICMVGDIVLLERVTVVD